MATGSEPPSDFDRLEMFCELVDDYESLMAAFPVDQSSFKITPVGHPDPPENEPNRWHRLVRAAALRKFVYGFDQMNLKRVLDSLEACVGPEHRGLVDEHRDWFAQLALTAPYDDGNGGTMTAQDLVLDFMYGAFLHGDWDRHQRFRQRTRIEHEYSLWQLTGEAELMITRIRDLIRDGFRKGIVTRRGD